MQLFYPFVYINICVHSALCGTPVVVRTRPVYNVFYYVYSISSNKESNSFSWH